MKNYKFNSYLYVTLYVKLLYFTYKLFNQIHYAIIFIVWSTHVNKVALSNKVTYLHICKMLLVLASIGNSAIHVPLSHTRRIGVCQHTWSQLRKQTKASNNNNNNNKTSNNKRTASRYKGQTRHWAPSTSYISIPRATLQPLAGRIYDVTSWVGSIGLPITL